MTTATERSRTRLAVVGWWALTLLTLVVLDDLTFGPIFWTISRLTDARVAFLLILAIYVPAQMILVRRGTDPDPGRVAEFFLKRLDVQRKRPEIAAREERVRDRIVGIGSALALSVVVAGVLPCLLLYRQGYSRRFVTAVSGPAAVIYAVEYGVLHAVVPASI